MFWRHRKVLRDRAAGLVFDWRKGHGSARRFIIAGIVAASCWGALLAYVQIREPEAGELVDKQIHLTLVDLDDDQNRWLADLIDRETLFHRRWDVSDPSIIESASEAALALHSPRTYEATLREITLPTPVVSLANLPGMEPEILPAPQQVDSVIFASPPVNWWVDVRAIDGPEGIEPFSFPWPKSIGEKGLSEGEIWTVLLAVDWNGEVVINEPTIQSDNARTSVILAKYRELEFEALSKKAPLRWWKLEARVVNRPLAE